jgi:hypothetical protein
VFGEFEEDGDDVIVTASEEKGKTRSIKESVKKKKKTQGRGLRRRRTN